MIANINTPTVDNADLPLVEMAAKKYSVEFFHIYTDETIGEQHQVSVDYLKSIEEAWGFDYDRIVLIDDYNPIKHVLSANEVLRYLEAQGMLPKYWAYEKDMVKNAKLLLESITRNKIRNNYLRYIESHGKYPCSLLTATWYLTRLGKLDSSMITTTNPHENPEFVPADRLFNLLPKDYRPVEERAREIILNSTFADNAHRIQDLFYPVSSGRAVDLF